MPNFTMKSDGYNNAQSASMTVANNEVVHITNFTDATIVGTFNISATSNFSVLDSDGRGPRGAELVSGLESAGDDPVIKLQPGGSILLVAGSAGALNVQEDDIRTTHGTVSADGQYVYVSLTNAVT